ncbi:MAG: FkbM family methyltransferase [Chloroflexi bacterium]|nr:FkbM family methyltransferase [Chloroflexota bacterium]
MPNPLLSLAAAAARWLPVPVRRALYRLGPVSSGVRSLLNRAAPIGLTETQVAGGGLAGTHLLLDLQTEKDYWLGNYEMDLQKAVRDFAHPGMVAFDLGANIGYISLLLAKAVGETGKVFAFEPLPANQERLNKNMVFNPRLRVILIPKAVTEKDGHVSFLIHASGTMGKVEGSAGREGEYAKPIKVETITLDNFVYHKGNPEPNLIKIDIEGGESMALQGMSRIIQEAKPTLLIELHGREAAQICWEILIQAGYKISKLVKGYPQISDFTELDWKSYILARPTA